MWRLVNVLHLGKVFWAKGSAVVAAPSPVDAASCSLVTPTRRVAVDSLPPGVNLLVLNVGDLTFLNSFCDHPDGAARDSSLLSLPDRELADYCLPAPLVPTALGRERRVTNEERPKDPFQRPHLAQGGVSCFPTPRTPAWLQASRWETGLGRSRGTRPLGAYLGNHNRARASSSSTATETLQRVLGGLTEVQPWGLPLVSRWTVDKSLPLSQSWFFHV